MGGYSTGPNESVGETSNFCSSLIISIILFNLSHLIWHTGRILQVDSDSYNHAFYVGNTFCNQISVIEVTSFVHYVLSLIVNHAIFVSFASCAHVSMAMGIQNGKRI